MRWLGDENNGSCDIYSLQYGSNLNCYIDGREDIMSKPFTDVDMIFILVNLGGDHWVLARADLCAKRVRIYDSSSSFNCFKMFDSTTSDMSCRVPTLGKLKLDFDSSHGHYFRKKIAVDIFTGNIAFYK
ncbi:hypothetical protein CUMW_072960 [Citrus unshiu]|nr:hypothetical protein CUMW_072960 [Citrus unshiu]